MSYLACECGCDNFEATQAYYLRVIVDANGHYIKNASEDNSIVFEDCENPSFPIQCVECDTYHFDGSKMKEMNDES